MDFPVTND